MSDIPSNDDILDSLEPWRMSMPDNGRVVVIGAGIGGLTAASLLLKAGFDVTVLEAHVYPGGSAGTFFHKGYRFDAGATLAGGFAPGGPHARLAETLGLTWPIQPVDPAWVVHLPGKIDHPVGRCRTLASGTAGEAAGNGTILADAGKVGRNSLGCVVTAVSLAAAIFVGLGDVGESGLRPSTLPAIPYLTRTIGSLTRNGSSEFRAFLDAQLLISAQTTADKANALYGSAALDLPRRGVNHVRGGIGNLAKTLADWIQENGGQVVYRQEATEIVLRNGRAAAVRTNKGLTVEADYLLANLTPWALVKLLGEDAPSRWRQQIKTTPATWGAFTLYLGTGSGAPSGRIARSSSSDC